MTDQTHCQLICVICGDRAIGYNFDVLSCESCKAFFRRAAFKELKCRFGGKCDTYLENRNSCRYCRKKRCLAAGMKKEWITTLEQRKVRKRVNKKKEQVKINAKQCDDKEHDNLSEPPCPSNNDNQVNAGYPVIVYAPNVMTNNLVCQVLESEPVESSRTQYAQGHSLNMSRTHSVESSPTVTPSASPTPTECKSPFSFLSELNHLDNDDTLVPVSRPVSDYRNNLTEIEGNYLTELLTATSRLKTPVGTVTSRVYTLHGAYRVLNWARWKDLERLVNVFKELIVFKDINKQDRFNVTRPGLNRVHYFRAVTGYFNDNHSDYMTVHTKNNIVSVIKSNLATYPKDKEMLNTCLVPLDVFRREKPILYEAQKNFYDMMSAEWDSDYVILDLMTMILMLSPDHPDLIDYHSIRLRQQFYKYLLQRYLLLRYRTEDKAEDKYRRLEMCLQLGYVLFERCRLNAIEENFCRSECSERTRKLIVSSGLG